MNFLLGVFPHQEGGGLPAGQMEGEPLNERLELDFPSRSSFRGPNHGTERVDDHDSGAPLFDLFHDPVQNPAQVSREHLLAQIHESDRPVQPVEVEKRELLLIAQHLRGGLAEHGEVDRVPFRSRVGEHDLLHQRGLPGARLSGHQIERVLGKPAPEHFIQARNTGRMLRDVDSPPTVHSTSPGCSPIIACSRSTSGRMVRSRRSVISSPSRETSRPTR